MSAGAMDEAFLRDLFGGLAPLTFRRVFSGKGVYSDGLIFALASFDRIWIKVDDISQPLFEEAGSVPMSSVPRAGRPISIRYWQLPDAALDDVEQAFYWARLGLDASRRAEKPARLPGPARRS